MFCSCCGVSKEIYEEQGHDNECVWYEEEMYRLANKFLNENDETNWKNRYNLIVKFLLEETKVLKNKCVYFL